MNHFTVNTDVVENRCTEHRFIEICESKMSQCRKSCYQKNYLRLRKSRYSRSTIDLQPRYIGMF